MVLKYHCEKCTKIFSYDGNGGNCCQQELSEIYFCDCCGISLTEDTVNVHEQGIVCYELCIVCLAKPKKKFRHC